MNHCTSLMILFLCCESTGWEELLWAGETSLVLAFYQHYYPSGCGFWACSFLPWFFCSKRYQPWAPFRWIPWGHECTAFLACFAVLFSHSPIPFPQLYALGLFCLADTIEGVSRRNGSAGIIFASSFCFMFLMLGNGWLSFLYYLVYCIL